MHRRTALFAALGLMGVLAAAPLAVQAQGAPAAALTTVPAQAQSGDYKFEPSHSKATWSVTHFGYSTYAGQFPRIEGTLKLDAKDVSKSVVDVTINTAAVGTLDEALDKHLKTADFLDVEKFPTATFKSTSVKQTGERTADITGDLTLHGVTKPVVVQATFNQAGPNPMSKIYTIGFDAKAKIKRSDFGITTYVPAIGDEVTLVIEAELQKTN